MNELCRHLCYHFFYDNTGFVCLSTYKPTYGGLYVDILWKYQFPDYIHLSVRKLNALTELVNTGMLTKEEARKLIESHE